LAGAVAWRTLRSKRVIAGYGGSVTEEDTADVVDAQLTILQVHLQEGFQDDEVVVAVDGEERLHEREVTTKLLLGTAGTRDVEVAPGPHEIEVRVPTRGLESMVSITVGNQPVQLGLSVENGHLTHIVKEGESFGYL
jgi:hypothetical protein